MTRIIFVVNIICLCMSVYPQGGQADVSSLGDGIHLRAIHYAQDQKDHLALAVQSTLPDQKTQIVLRRVNYKIYDTSEHLLYDWEQNSFVLTNTVPIVLPDNRPSMIGQFLLQDLDPGDYVIRAEADYLNNDNEMIQLQSDAVVIQIEGSQKPLPHEGAKAQTTPDDDFLDDEPSLDHDNAKDLQTHRGSVSTAQIFGTQPHVLSPEYDQRTDTVLPESVRVQKTPGQDQAQEWMDTPLSSTTTLSESVAAFPETSMDDYAQDNTDRLTESALLTTGSHGGLSSNYADNSKQDPVEPIMDLLKPDVFSGDDDGVVPQADESINTGTALPSETVMAPRPITVSGLMPVGHNFAVLVNGEPAGTYLPDDTGQFKVDLMTIPGDVLTFYLTSGPQKGAHIIMTSGQSSITGIFCLKDTLMLGNQTGDVMQNAHLMLANKHRFAELTALYFATENSLRIPDGMTLMLLHNFAFRPMGIVQIGTTGSSSALYIPHGRWLSEDLESLEVFGSFDLSGIGSYIGGQEHVYVNGRCRLGTNFDAGQNTLTLGPLCDRITLHPTAPPHNVVVNTLYRVLWGSWQTSRVSGDLTILSTTKIRSSDGHKIYVSGDIRILLPSIQMDASLILDGVRDQNVDISRLNSDATIQIIVDKPQGRVRLVNDLLYSTNPAYPGQSLVITRGLFDLNGHDLLAQSGSFVVEGDGILALQGHEHVPPPVLHSGSTVVYEGAESYSGLACGGHYEHLVFNGSGVWTLSQDLDVDGDLRILQGTLDIFDGSRHHDIHVAGHWDNQGHFEAGQGRVVLDGASHQHLRGSTTWHHFKAEAFRTRSLFIESTSTQTILGSLMMTGAPGEFLALRPLTPHTPWTLDARGSVDMNYMFLDDIDAVTPIDLSTAVIRYGGNNNINWTFPIQENSPVAPILATAMSDVTFNFGETWSRDVYDVDLERSPSVFHDLQGDPLSYHLVSAPSDVVETTIAGTRLQVIPLGVGHHEVVLQAQNSHGASVHVSFQIDVKPAHIMYIADAAQQSILIIKYPDVNLLQLNNISPHASYSLEHPPVMIKRSPDHTFLYVLQEPNIVDILDIAADPGAPQLVARLVLPGTRPIDMTFYADRYGETNALIICEHAGVLKVSVQGQASKILGTMDVGDMPVSITSGPLGVFVALDGVIPQVMRLDLDTEQPPQSLLGGSVPQIAIDVIAQTWNAELPQVPIHKIFAETNGPLYVISESTPDAAATISSLDIHQTPTVIAQFSLHEGAAPQKPSAYRSGYDNILVFPDPALFGALVINENTNQNIYSIPQFRLFLSSSIEFQ